MIKCQLQITAEGGVWMLQDDAVDLRLFGKVTVKRASHVEFSNSKQMWFVKSAKTKKYLHWAPTRAAALAWEKKFYSPSGKGWKELTGGKS